MLTSSMLLRRITAVHHRQRLQILSSLCSVPSYKAAPFSSAAAAAAAAASKKRNKKKNENDEKKNKDDDGEKKTLPTDKFLEATRAEKQRRLMKWGIGMSLLGGVILAYSMGSKKTYKEKRGIQTTKTKLGAEIESIPIRLTDRYGKPFDSRSLKGKYFVVYFGFTHCPDICPSELTKLSNALEAVEENTRQEIIPLFVSIDPKRDKPARLLEYSLANPFHPRMEWLYGSDEELKSLCKSYKVYYTTPPADQDDYLLDHSTFVYIFNPEGEFIDVFGKQYTAFEMGEGMSYLINEDQATRGVKVTRSLKFRLAQIYSDITSV